MKRTLLYVGCLSLAFVSYAVAAQANPYQNVSDNDQYQTTTTTTYSTNAPVAVVQPQQSSFNVVAYNNDAPARNRGEYYTGSNMGPGGRNSGFDDNTALHPTSSRHIDDTDLAAWGWFWGHGYDRRSYNNNNSTY